MPETMAPSDAPEDELHLVDNPFRRESHRPWYARRAARWVVGLSILGLLAVNAVAFKKVGQRADPITVDAALARYRSGASSRQQLRTASGSPSTSVPSPGSTVGQASAERASTQPDAAAEPTGTVGVERGPTPTPGVYVYDTEGFERVSALGGAQHDYPQRTTMTVTASDCGVNVRWTPLEQRFENWDICLNGSAMELRSFITHHEFFGQTEERHYACQSTFLRLVSDAPGTEARGSCTSPTDQAVTREVVIGPEQVVVQGIAVDAVRVHLDQSVTGGVRGTEKGDVWVRVTDGVLLRFEAVLDGDANSVIGPTHFHEEFKLNLAELEPRQ